MKWGRKDRQKLLWELFTNCTNVSKAVNKTPEREGGRGENPDATRKHKYSISENYVSPCNLCSANMKNDRGNFIQTLLPLTALLKNPLRESWREKIILDCLVKAIKTRWPGNGQTHVKVCKQSSAYSELDSEREEEEEEGRKRGWWFNEQHCHNVKSAGLIISVLLQRSSVQAVRTIRMDLVKELESKGST